MIIWCCNIHNNLDWNQRLKDKRLILWNIQTLVYITKMESTLFVCENLSFSKNLRCLNLALTQAQKSVTRHFWWLKKLCNFFILALSKNFWSFLEFVCWQHCSHTGKFKHLKFLENVKIIGTNNIDSILDLSAILLYSMIGADLWS